MTDTSTTERPARLTRYGTGTGAWTANGWEHGLDERHPTSGRPVLYGKIDRLPYTSGWRVWVATQREGSRFTLDTQPHPTIYPTRRSAATAIVELWRERNADLIASPS